MVGTASNRRLSRLFAMIGLMVGIRFAAIILGAVVFAYMLTFHYIESDRFAFWLNDAHFMNDAGFAEKIRILGNPVKRVKPNLYEPIPGKCLHSVKLNPNGQTKASIQAAKQCVQDSMYVSIKKTEKRIQDEREIRLGYAKGFWLIVGIILLACLLLRAIVARRQQEKEEKANA